MSAVRVRAAGLDALRRRLAALPTAAQAAVAPAMLDVAERAADAVRASLGMDPGAPDDPVGRLAAAVSAGPSETGSAVAVAAPDAAFLEYGTLRMAPRPFLRPAAERAGQGAPPLLAAALKGLRP